MRPDPRDLGGLSPAQVQEMVNANRIWSPTSWYVGWFTRATPEQLKLTAILIRLLQILLHGASIGVAAYMVTLLRPEVAGQYVFALVCPCLTLPLVFVHLLVMACTFRNSRLLGDLGGKILLLVEALAALLWFAVWITVTYDQAHQICTVPLQCTLRAVYLGLSIVEFLLFCFMVFYDASQCPGFSMERQVAANQAAYDREAAANREYTGLPMGRVLDDSRKPTAGFVNTVPNRSLSSVDTRR